MAIEVNTQVMTECAGREFDNAAITREHTRPDTALIEQIMLTHGPQAAPLSVSLCEYYASRASAGTTNANNYEQTAQALHQSAGTYSNTESANASSMTT